MYTRNPEHTRADIIHLCEDFIYEMRSIPLSPKAEHVRRILIAELAFFTGDIEIRIEADLEKLHN